MDLSTFSDDELIGLYPILLSELRIRGIANTRNLVSEVGEYLVFQHYANAPEKPSLSKVSHRTRIVRAVDPITGDRYSIKVTTGSATGVFHSIDVVSDEQEFEYLIILRMTDDLKVSEILELNWNQFVKHRRMKNPEKKWYVPVTESLRQAANVRFN